MKTEGRTGERKDTSGRGKERKEKVKGIGNECEQNTQYTGQSTCLTTASVVYSDCMPMKRNKSYIVLKQNKAKPISSFSPCLSSAPGWLLPSFCTAQSSSCVVSSRKPLSSILTLVALFLPRILQLSLFLNCLFWPLYHY